LNILHKRAALFNWLTVFLNYNWKISDWEEKDLMNYQLAGISGIRSHPITGLEKFSLLTSAVYLSPHGKSPYL